MQRRLIPPLAKLFSLAAFLAGLAASAFFAWKTSARYERVEEERAALLFEPLAALPDSQVFLTPTAAAMRDGGLADTESLMACRDPSFWRSMDRSKRFRGVVLAGNLVEFKPLLDHLLDSPDWRLLAITPDGFAFVRGARVPYAPPSIEELTQLHEGSEALAQLAVNLAAAGCDDASTRCLREAQSRDNRSPYVWTCAALVELEHKQPAKAMESAGRALELNPRYVPALQAKIQACMLAGRHEEAYKLARALSQTAPDDLSSLILQARAAHAVNAFQREAEWLENAIRVARKQGADLTGLQVLLGQAYAKQGQAAPALRCFQEALASSSLSKEARADIESTISQIEANL